MKKLYKNTFRGVFCCFHCLLLCLSVNAQVPSYKSPETATAEALVAATADDYFARQISRQTQRIDPCAINLCSARTLPVKLTSFRGRRLDEKNVSLFWETSQEVNNHHFDVERAVDPSQGYEKVATVKGAGSSVSAVKYTLSDPNDYPDYTYYRLKQVDMDGAFEYSTVIAVNGGLGELAVHAFPNPAPYKDIAFKVTGQKVSESLSVVVFDASGRIVYRNDQVFLSSGEQAFRVNLQKPVPGKYSVTIGSKDRRATGSFVLVP